MRLAVAVIGALVVASAAARADVPDLPTRLPELVVRAQDEGTIGTAESASEGTVPADALEERPLLRPGEVLETVPGLIVTQHSGEGKANQYFLRGFNLDHGTDFATRVDGVPVNLPTHAHGQGYTDLNFLIPELVESVSYKKGPYSAQNGDFASAGSADLHYFDVLPRGLALFETGTGNYYRSVVAASPELWGGHLLCAGEVLSDDGPWQVASNFLKGNVVLRWSTGSDAAGASVTTTGYSGDWTSTDQIAERAVERGLVSRFGSLDDSDGGDSRRFGASAEWHGTSDRARTQLLAYGFYQDLDLFSNFTYALDPVHGDQIEQRDIRWVSGLRASETWDTPLDGVGIQTTLGLELRNDAIRNGLFKTTRRTRWATTRTDVVNELALAPYLESAQQWTEWLRTTAGVRFDTLHVRVDSDLAANSGGDTASLASPKLGLVLGPWAHTELYLNGGLGFHSNDGRGATTQVDPSDPNVPVRPVDLLARTYGFELGLRSAPLPHLESTLALWQLDLSSELVFAGDAGTTEPSRPSRRYGLELTNVYAPTDWVALDADLAVTHARFTNGDPVGDHIPGAPNLVASAGVTLKHLHGFFGGPRLRYFGPRPLVEDGSVRSRATSLVSARVGYEFENTWTLSADIFNLLDAKDDDITYFYASRLPGEPPGPDGGGTDDLHFHPVEKRSLRVSLSGHF
ncbi:MAG TPA: TonB-dependent receptor [Myxococcota bacterium]|nr:TonB-dependent receptor [Myxococcota bacterium]